MDKIKMLSASQGADQDASGVSLSPKWYMRGRVYQVVPAGQTPREGQIGQALAKVFCETGVAEIEGAEKSAPPSEDHKKLEGAPENKATKPASKPERAQRPTRGAQPRR